jgi:cell division protease FtsH
MVLRYGMDAALGPVALAEPRPAFPVPVPGLVGETAPAAGAKTAARIDDAVRELLEAAQQRAARLLQERREAFDRAVAALVAEETLDEARLLVLAGPVPGAPGTAAAPPPRRAIAPGA